jgi:hypothetical protein
MLLGIARASNGVSGWMHQSVGFGSFAVHGNPKNGCFSIAVWVNRNDESSHPASIIANK